jgi:magnesium-protoporphyrin IX monomethyl ester (oxidative) cyclase
LRRIAHAGEAAHGPFAWLKRAGCAVAAAGTFIQLFLLPVRPNNLPETIRVVPAW